MKRRDEYTSNNEAISAEQAREVFDYNPETGSLTWKNPRARYLKPGDKAGSLNKNGNRHVWFNERAFLAHRLAWLIHYGSLPVANIRAKNGNYDDLRICNLEERSFAETAQNANYAPNKSGSRGVHYEAHTKKWRAEISRNYKLHQLGRFNTKEEAEAAYRRASVEIKYEISPEKAVEYRTRARTVRLVRGVWERMGKELGEECWYRWPNYESFCDEVGPHVFTHARAVATTKDQPIGPGNIRLEPMAPFDRSTEEGRKAYYTLKNRINRTSKKDSELRKKFSMSYEEFKARVAEQNGVCAICQQPETAVNRGRVRELSVDHCHKTGAIRDLLCQNCNGMIGYARENPASLRSGADYIERHLAKKAEAPETE